MKYAGLWLEQTSSFDIHEPLEPRILNTEQGMMKDGLYVPAFDNQGVRVTFRAKVKANDSGYSLNKWNYF